jgi:hypothetical protein
MTYRAADQLAVGRGLKEKYHVNTRVSCTTCHR